MSGHEYTCAGCGGTFTSDRSADDAKEDARTRDIVPGDPDDGEEWEVVCDDCYREITRWAQVVGIAP